MLLINSWIIIYIQVICITIVLPLKVMDFNYVLDAKYPLLITNVLNKGTVSSQFGMSVALSKGPSWRSSSIPSGWLFIGAPTANLTNQKEIFQPGALWRCSLGKSGSDTCEIINIDPIKKDKKGVSVTRGTGSPQTEDEGNTWIGGSVEIKSGRLVTCGHRYTRGQKTFMNGICYWYSDNSSSYREKELYSVQKDSYSNRLIPFFAPLKDNNAPDQYFEYTDSAGNTTGHEWGLGQAGTSVHLINNISGGHELLLGAPGVRLWSGAVVRYIDNLSKTKGRNFRLNRNLSDPTYSEFVVGYRDRRNITSKNHWFDYFGYGVSSGRYFNQNELLYVAGAPRGSDLSGEVVIFQIPKENPLDPDSVYKRSIDPVLEIVPPSEAFGSYFGSVLLSIDVDGDGRDELFVGAPLYTQQRLFRRKRSSDFTTTSSGDHGCVFVYWFNSTSRDLEGLPQVLNGSETEPAARFGSAISYVSWMSNTTNKLEMYIVIGAPYEDHGRGTVHIYKVEKRFTFTFVQKISAHDISESIFGFGASLSLPEDIDHNETPDLAVGAYKSNQVVILRTRPRILLTGIIKSGNLPRGANTLKFSSCALFNKDLGNVNSDLSIWVSINLDYRLMLTSISTISSTGSEFESQIVESRQYSYSSSTNKIIYQENLSVNLTKCRIIVTKIKDQERFKNIDTDPEPFKIVQGLSYNKTSETIVKVLEYKVFSETGTVNKTSKFGFESFNSGLPSPISSIPQIYQIEISPNDCTEHNKCKPNLKVTTEWFNPMDESRTMPIKEYIIGTFSKIVLRVNITNDNETAEKPTFDIDWNINDINARKEDSEWLRKPGRCEKKGSSFNCRFPNNIVKNRPETVEVVFNLKELKAREPNETFHVDIGIVIDPARNLKTSGEAKLFLIAQSKIKLVGSKHTENLRNPFIYNITEVGLEFSRKSEEIGQISKELYSSWRQTYTVHNLGPSSVASTMLSFKIPWARKEKGSSDLKPLILVRHKDGCTTEPGKGHLYIIEHADSNRKTNRTNNMIDVPVPGAITITSITSDNDLIPALQRRRRKRETNAISIDYKTQPDPKKDPLFKVENNMIFIHCHDKSEFACIEINCKITNLKGNSFVEFPFELYIMKETIDELVTDGKQMVLVQSYGLAEIFSYPDIMEYRDTDLAQTLLIMTIGNVAEWVYVVAILCGILQLLLIVFILYKCGFFKREAKQKLQLLKEEARKSMMVPTDFNLHLEDEDIAAFEERSGDLLIDSEQRMSEPPENKEPESIKNGKLEQSTEEKGSSEVLSNTRC